MKGRSLRWPFALAGACLACVEMPGAPEDAEDLSALSARYEAPTAVVPSSRVDEVLANASRDVRLIELLAHLRFVKTLVSNTSTGLEGNSAAQDLEVGGVVDATFVCPGDGPRATEDRAANGLVRARFGVHTSHLKRDWTGTLERCLLRLTPAASEPESVSLSGRLVGDLGVDLPLGDALATPLLLKVRDLLATTSGQTSGARADFGREELHFRVTPDDAVETLVDAEGGGLAVAGSIVIGVREDDSLYVRDRRNTWTCTGGDRACALAP